MPTISVHPGQPPRHSLAMLRRAGALLCLFIAMASTEDATTTSLPDPPLVSWPEGVYGLHEIIAHCTDQIDGARLRLALDVEDSLPRRLEAFSGSWWEAVLTIAAAWDLRCDMTDTEDHGSTRRPARRPLAGPRPEFQQRTHIDIRSLPQINPGPWTLRVRKATPILRPGTQASAVVSGPLLLILDDMRIIDGRQASTEARSSRWLGLSARVYQCPVSLPDMIVHEIRLEPSAPLSENPVTLQFLGIAANDAPDMLLSVAGTDQSRVSIDAAMTAVLSPVHTSAISLPPNQSLEDDDGPRTVWYWNASGTNDGSQSLGFSIPSSSIGLSISPAPRQQPEIEVRIDGRVIPVELFRVRSIKSRQIDVMQCTIRLPPAVTDAKPLTVSATIFGSTRYLPLSLETTVEMP